MNWASRLEAGPGSIVLAHCFEAVSREPSTPLTKGNALKLQEASYYEFFVITGMLLVGGVLGFAGWQFASWE